VHKRWKYENELKYSPKTESRDREIEFAFTCNSGCYAPFPDAGSLPLFSCGNEASMCQCVCEEVEISKTLDRYSIIEIISKYNKELASVINKMSICKIEHPKTKNAYKSSIAQLTKAFDRNENYFNDKFKQYYKFNQDIVNIVICHSLKSLWISIYYGSH